MEATELRIGNWVIVNEECQIEAIVHDAVCISTRFETYVLDDVKPIPLTEEWLIKFGFESNPYIDTYELYELDELKFILDIDKTRGKLDIHWKQVECKYVHSLQNLFHSLTGEELTIK